MQRRDFIFGSVTALMPRFARAQTQQMPVIGFLSSGSPGAFSNFEKAFRQGLAEQGFVDGRIWVEFSWAEGRYDQLGAMANDLVKKRVALIVASGGVISAKAALKATSSVPVVFVVGADPVRVGLVPRIGRPGGNATGASLFSLELATKRMEMLKQALKLVGDITFAILVNPGSITTDIEIADTITAADKINKIEQKKTAGDQSKLNILVLKASTEEQLEAAILSATQRRVAAVLVSGDPFFTTRRKQVVALFQRHGIPAMYPWRDYVRDGGLMSYGTEVSWAYHLVGVYSGRILKGEKVGDLPVEMPSKFDLSINLKAAAALGLKIDPELLAVVDEVFE